MRTTLLNADGHPRYTNRLVHESSPYLLQHAHNPVDWYPWGNAAFDLAAAQDKPVFLSIGYSTCHWCHVMEHESFDNEEIADFLNQHFVSIKLDREQRPDLDDIYMTGVQMLTGQGGWPMSNFLTSAGKPFYAGTYFPPDNFMALLQQIATVWHERRDDLLKQADEVTTGISRFTAARAESRNLVDDLTRAASAELLGRFDTVNGGFGGAPKFPNENQLLLLLEDWQRHRSPDVFEVLSVTLDKMGAGGIYDQIAGGFHRYTVDAAWLVPHFEKMLYNQAQLVRVYSRAAALSLGHAGRFAWRRVVEQTVGYLTRDMSNGQGGFYSATDADSEGEEGRFFVWRLDELQSLLNANDLDLVKKLYGVTEGGNFEGRTILNLQMSLEACAEDQGVGLAELVARLDDINSRLYQAREAREHPLRDEKVITAWNGMMITSLAHASIDLNDATYVALAVRAAQALWDTAWSPEDRMLFRITLDSECSIPGNLEDYACLAEALLTLYQVTFDDTWLERGRQIVTEMLALFWDETDGGFFLARAEGEGPMITRPRSPMDGATASGNSVALHSLVRLFEVTGDSAIEAKITATINAFAGLLTASPSAFCYFIVAAEQYRTGCRGPVQFTADGNIRVVARRGEDSVKLDFSFRGGWHINGHDIGDVDLVPTTVVAGNATVNYPPGKEYRHEVHIDVTGMARDIEVTLQPCNSTVCLAPTTLRFSVG